MKLTKFTAGLVALSLATAGVSATPARASDQDAALALGGLLTLFVIGKALEDQKGKVTVSRTPAPQPRVQDHGRDHDRDHGRTEDRFRDHHAEREIPNQCVLSARRGSSQRLVAFENCVERETHAKVNLPRACETRVSMRGHWNDAYDIGCLSNFGYRVTADRSDRHGGDRISTRSHK